MGCNLTESDSFYVASSRLVFYLIWVHKHIWFLCTRWNTGYSNAQTPSLDIFYQIMTGSGHIISHNFPKMSEWASISIIITMGNQMLVVKRILRGNQKKVKSQYYGVPTCFYQLLVHASMMWKHLRVCFLPYNKCNRTHSFSVLIEINPNIKYICAISTRDASDVLSTLPESQPSLETQRLTIE